MQKLRDFFNEQGKQILIGLGIGTGLYFIVKHFYTIENDTYDVESVEDEEEENYVEIETEEEKEEEVPAEASQEKTIELKPAHD